jgi:hypothetical protein
MPRTQIGKFSIMRSCKLKRCCEFKPWSGKKQQKEAAGSEVGRNGTQGRGTLKKHTAAETSLRFQKPGGMEVLLMIVPKVVSEPAMQMWSGFWPRL